MHGFTLIEVLVTMAFAAISASIAPGGRAEGQRTLHSPDIRGDRVELRQ
ncbi:prepilin-type N-terminal cleavage/methylation domain-containing protein [Variovorax paradoxus]